MNCIISETELVNFRPRFEVVSCFLEYGGKHLLLERHDDKSQGGKWGPPAGKIDVAETAHEAIAREVFEETSLRIPSDTFIEKGKYFVRYPEYDFVYYVFQASLQIMPEVKIEPKEHRDFKWVEAKEALDLPLVLGQDEIIKRYYQIEL